MRSTLTGVAVAAALLATAPAHAHFVWVTMDPGVTPAVARVTFGEFPDAGEPSLVARIAQTRVVAGGKSLETRQAEDGLVAELPNLRTAAVDALCDYGVVTKRGPAFLLQYAARAQARPEPSDSASGVVREHPRLVWIAGNGSAPEVRAVWRGRPVAGASVKVFVEDGDPREAITDAEGIVPDVDPTRTPLLLSVVEPAPGRRDGQDYTEIRHYATLTSVETQDVGARVAAEASADERLRIAHEARACWGPNFPGFNADLVVRVDDEAVRGTLDVAPDGAVTLDLPDGPAKDWARAQLRSIVMHRGIHGPTELETGARFLETTEEHPLGRLIQLADDRMGSAYRVRGDEITEVNRTMGERRFSNRILANSRNAEGKLLPLAYTVSYWTVPGDRLERVEAFHATWTRVGPLDLPSTHTQITSADGLSTVRQIELSNHRLKAASATAAAPK
jgi:hypothetical protein